MIGESERLERKQGEGPGAFEITQALFRYLRSFSLFLLMWVSCGEAKYLLKKLQGCQTGLLGSLRIWDERHFSALALVSSRIIICHGRLQTVPFVGSVGIEFDRDELLRGLRQALHGD